MILGTWPAGTEIGHYNFRALTWRCLNNNPARPTAQPAARAPDPPARAPVPAASIHMQNFRFLEFQTIGFITVGAASTVSTSNGRAVQALRAPELMFEEAR